MPLDVSADEGRADKFRLPAGYLEDVLFVVARNGASFTGRCREGSGIAITVSGAPGDDERTVRVTLSVPSARVISGHEDFRMDVDFDELADVIGEHPEETFVEFFVNKLDPEGDIDGDIKLSEFYESLDVPLWDLGVVEDHASDFWYLCHDSEEDCIADLAEQRREGMMRIDDDVTDAVGDLVSQMESETRRRSLGASRIQKNWRAISSSPYTGVGARVIARRFYD
jgi:hypothetical protein